MISNGASLRGLAKTRRAPLLSSSRAPSSHDPEGQVCRPPSRASPRKPTQLHWAPSSLAPQSEYDPLSDQLARSILRTQEHSNFSSWTTHNWYCVSRSVKLKSSKEERAGGSKDNTDTLVLSTDVRSGPEGQCQNGDHSDTQSYADPGFGHRPPCLQDLVYTLLAICIPQPHAALEYYSEVECDNPVNEHEKLVLSSRTSTLSFHREVHLLIISGRDAVRTTRILEIRNSVAASKEENASDIATQSFERKISTYLIALSLMAGTRFWIWSKVIPSGFSNLSAIRVLKTRSAGVFSGCLL